MQISTRLLPEDAEFIEQLQADGATTASEKIRAIIHEVKRRHEGEKDYEAALRLVDDLTRPPLHRVRETEERTGQHSALVAQVSDWLGECFAYLLSHAPDAHAGPEDPAELATLEAGLTQRAFRLTEALLRLGVTPESPTYDPKIIRAHLGPTLAMARVLATETKAPHPGLHSDID